MCGLCGLQTIASVASQYHAITDVLYFRTPNYSDVCGNVSTQQSCGYKPISIVNPAVMLKTPHVVPGGAVSCPPVCPGAVDAKMGASGVFYTPTCQNFANGSVCLDAATARSCAFGVGDSCERCPVGCICPGGARCWCV